MSLVVANWKMYGSLAFLNAFIATFLDKIPTLQATQVAICPPFVYLPMLERHLAGSQIALGAQNVHFKAEGAYTGEISVNMLKEFGCQYVIIGHSERRQAFRESQEFIKNKILAVQTAGLIPILCVGETQDDHLAHKTESVIATQLSDFTKGAFDCEKFVVAYEPVWAIGTGHTPTLEDIESVHRQIRGLFGGAGETLKVLYGGSVNPENAKMLFQSPEISGGLIGGASLNPEAFSEIVNIAETIGN